MVYHGLLYFSDFSACFEHVLQNPMAAKKPSRIPGRLRRDRVFLILEGGNRVGQFSIRLLISIWRPRSPTMGAADARNFRKVAFLRAIFNRPAGRRNGRMGS